MYGTGTYTERLLSQIVAETEAGDPDHGVVVGTHLDSAPEGPSINDDGSGTAAACSLWYFATARDPFGAGTRKQAARRRARGGM